LGGAEVTPLELTAAYAAFANGGFGAEPVSILRVEKRNGELLHAHPFDPQTQVLDSRVAYLISDILDDDVARVPAMGNDNPLALPFPAAAKTGTTNDFRDNWTVGFTPALAVGVWTGNTDNSPMIDVSGLSGAAPLWSDYMQAVYADPAFQESLQINGLSPDTEFSQPAGLSQEQLCAISSVVIGAQECALSGSEWLLDTPQQVDDTQPGPDDVIWESIEPAVDRLPALPLPPIPVELINLEAEEDSPPAQLFCHFPEGSDATLLPPETQTQVFLSPPRNPQSLKAAHEWAQKNNLALLPTETCNDDLLALARDPNRVAFWRITEPIAGDAVSGILPIMGTADFDPAEVEFFKIELGIPNGPDVQWLTLGETHNVPVVNGVLEMLHAEALAPGDYFLRLIVVRDSNYVGDPHTIPITIER
jgi:hypothetical protein